MKWLRTIVLFDKGDLASTTDWENLHDSYVRAIKGIENPRGSGALILRKKVQLPSKQWMRNGVGYLRKEFLTYMLDHEGWGSESEVALPKSRVQPKLHLYPSMEEYKEPITSDFGGFDFTAIAVNGTRIAIEWETGNISSSHRSMNKLAIALSAGLIEVGVLIVPSKALYEHLTDRVGNIGELSGYLAMWASMKTSVKRGLLAITVVEHDSLTESKKIKHLSVGGDGRAREGKAKQ
jgi:Restriction endonuclease BamHI